jgi:hypothetical protein
MSPTREVRIAGSILGRYRHICAFFHSREEEYRVTLPFIREGLAQGEGVFQIVDRPRQVDHIRRLEEAGIDVAHAQRTQQMEIRNWDESYLQDGNFNWQRQLTLIEDVLKGGRAKGLPRMRVTGSTDWAILDRPGVHDLLEYESRLNDLLANYDDPVCCLYDVSKFSASVILEALRVHPVVIIGGVLQENPFYVSPGEFLQELSERHAAGGAGPVENED